MTRYKLLDGLHSPQASASSVLCTWDKAYFLALGTLLTSGVGALLHFVYEWSGEQKVVGWLAPVNESVWEHLKLVWLPVFLWVVSVKMCCPHRNRDMFSYMASCATGVLVGFIVVLLSYYMYVYSVGSDSLAWDLSTYVVAMGTVLIVGEFTEFPNIMALLMPFYLVIFAVLTEYPTNHPVFKSN